LGYPLSLLDNPYGRPPNEKLAPWSDGIENGKRSARNQRERDYIDALAAYYYDYQKTPYDMRVQAYLKAMKPWPAAIPTTDEAQIVYALGVEHRSLAHDKTYANQLRGAAILENYLQAPAAASGRRPLPHPSL